MPKHLLEYLVQAILLHDTAHSVQPPTHKVLSAAACAGFRPLVVLRNCATNQSIGCSVNVDDVVGNNQTTIFGMGCSQPALACTIFFQTYCPNIICRNHCVSALYKTFSDYNLQRLWTYYILIRTCVPVHLATNKMGCHLHPPICESPLVQAMIGLFHYVKELCYLSELSFSCRSRLEIPILSYGQCLLDGTL